MGSGVLITTDGRTVELYTNSDWEVVLMDYHNRGELVGWRVRETMRMMSTISDEQRYEVLTKAIKGLSSRKCSRWMRFAG